MEVHSKKIPRFSLPDFLIQTVNQDHADCRDGLTCKDPFRNMIRPDMRMVEMTVSTARTRYLMMQTPGKH